MSFISVVATEKFVTIMADGRVVNMDSGEIIEENFIKYLQVNEKAFIAFTGTKDTGEAMAETIARRIIEGEDFAKIHQILIGTIESLKEIITDSRPVSIAFGGFNKEGEAELRSYASKSKQTLQFKPKGHEFATTLMTGANSSLDEKDLHVVFEGFMREAMHGNIDPSPSQIIQAQKLMNKYVSERDYTVNNITSRLVLKK
ncbi:hypothetical protein [Paenibacillus sp. P32E]|uniref:hypothetical protein n=1 Tax=Paenibacillus sp. P32E TaxID=1349434 RepID=UPI00093F0457|nr:hypothetical protein [Paenibacillus sp. P32E]OKP91312.1 hypothetical protein A3848_09395 [Paenibacillus sp. P32E]